MSSLFYKQFRQGLIKRFILQVGEPVLVDELKLYEKCENRVSLLNSINIKTG